MTITEADYQVEDREYETPCWIWQHYVNIQGYGKVGIGGRVLLAHVAMYVQTYGPVPDGAELDHLCRVPACVRPDHLEPVGHRENIRRGRATRLTDEQVTAILADPRSSYAIARDYGIHHSYAWALKARRASRTRQ